MNRVHFQIMAGFQSFVFGAMLLFQTTVYLQTPDRPQTALALYFHLACGLCLLFWLWLFINPPCPFKIRHWIVFLLGSLASLFAAPLLCYACAFSNRRFLFATAASGGLDFPSILVTLIYFAMLLAVFATPISLLISWACTAGGMISIFDETDPSKKNRPLSK